MSKDSLSYPIINPNQFYRAKDIEDIFGKRYIATLRLSGLRAVGDWYLGANILEAHNKAAAERQKGKEDFKNEFGNKAMEKDFRPVKIRGLQSFSKQKKENSLRNQLEEIGK